MARRTGDGINELKIEDHISGSEIVLFFRMPTTKEQTAYTNGVMVRKRNKLVSQQGEMRMKYGAKILMGFKTGSFEKPLGDKWALYASDETDKHYDPHWKVRVLEHASDLVELLAMHVFERPAEVDADEPDEADEPEDNEDLEKNLQTISEP